MSQAKQTQSPTDALETAVKLACEDIITRETRANIARVQELAQHPEVLQVPDYNHASTGTNHHIGHILSRADYANEWSDGSYMIDIDLLKSD